MRMDRFERRGSAGCFYFFMCLLFPLIVSAQNLPPIEGGPQPVNLQPPPVSSAPADVAMPPPPPPGGIGMAPLSQDMCENTGKWNVVTLLIIGFVFSILALLLRRFMARRAIMTHGQQILAMVAFAVVLSTVLGFFASHFNEHLFQCASDVEFCKYVALCEVPVFLREFILSGLPSGVLGFILMLIFRG